MLTNEDRKYILNEFLSNIDGISDLEYQKRVWIRGEGPEVDNFDETVCHFFDDGDPILKNYKDYGITDSQYQLLKQFRGQFMDFSDKHHWPEGFIAIPEWEKITEMAKKVLKTFNYQKER